MNFNLQGDGVSAALELRKTFFKWQCRVSQLAVREHAGRPDPSIMPLIRLGPNLEEIGYIITLIHKLPRFSVTSELRHIAKKTFDPLQRRDQAIRFLSATYYQKADEFADIFTATFAQNSQGAEQIHLHGNCIAVFEAYSQRFKLKCKVWKLSENNIVRARFKEVSLSSS